MFCGTMHYRIFTRSDRVSVFQILEVVYLMTSYLTKCVTESTTGLWSCKGALVFRIAKLDIKIVFH